MKYAPLFLCLLLCACASPSVSVCPKIRTYTRTEQLNQAAAEDFLPANSPLIDPLLEWASLRAQLKACNTGS